MEDEADMHVAEDDGFPLVEGWMLGMLMFPAAMAEVVRNPPANDAGTPPAD